MPEAETFDRTQFAERIQVLGPAMRFALLLAWLRTTPRQLAATPYAQEVPDCAVDLPPVALLWELVERYHPEQTWLAVLWTRGERNLEDITRTAPREALAPALIQATRRAESQGLWSSPSATGRQLSGVRASLRSALLEPSTSTTAGVDRVG